MSTPARNSEKTRAAAPSHKRNRSFGRRSPLDKLPIAVRDELAMRCLGEETYAQLATWLRKSHRLKVSQEAISKFAMRREEMRQIHGKKAGASQSAIVDAGSFEIVIFAPGASELRVQVRPLPPSAT